MKEITASLDSIANYLETIGKVKEAYEIDMYSNTIEKLAASGMILNSIRDLADRLEGIIKDVESKEDLENKNYTPAYKKVVNSIRNIANKILPSLRAEILSV